MFNLKPLSKQNKVLFILNLVGKLKQGMVPNFNQVAALHSIQNLLLAGHWIGFQPPTALMLSFSAWLPNSWALQSSGAKPYFILQWDATPSREIKIKAIWDYKVGSVLTGSDRHSLLEHSLPVASVLREVFRRWGTINLAFFSLRPQRKHKIIPGSMFPNPPLEHSLPVASVLTGSDRHSLLEHYLS